MRKLIFLIMSVCLLPLVGYAQNSFIINDSVSIISVGKSVYLLEDSASSKTFEDILNDSTGFKLNTTDIPNLGVSSSSYWVKLSLTNHTQDKNYVLELSNPIIDVVEFYDTSNKLVNPVIYTNLLPFNQRSSDNISFVFPLNLEYGKTKTIFFKVKSSTQLLLPIYVGEASKIYSNAEDRTLIQGIYFGIMLVMFLYNFFILLTVRDISYFYYIFYILSVALVQVVLSGVGFKYIWPDYPGFERWAAYIFSAFTAFSALGFIKKFLKTETLIPKIDRLSWIFVIAYSATILAAVLDNRILAYNLLNINGLLLSLYMLYEGIYVLVKYKTRESKFFLIAWSGFLSSVILFVLKDTGVLPYNNITASILQIGSAFEAIMLSFALADRINILKKEKEFSQAEALRIAKENEKIIREQNIVLEQKVTERTFELKESNNNLNKTLEELKQTQTQLVEQEKMASLGQLTAGVAHEINNPINFVLANVKPIKRDIDILLEMINTLETIGTSDLTKEQKLERIETLKNECDYDYLKKEIEFLLKGINEGSSRTAEIVRGLRIFSRVDEDDIKMADVNEGLDSTIVICNNLLGSKIKITKNYTTDAVIECYPGKLNQVFMNMLSNAIYATKAKFKEEAGGEIQIETQKQNGNLIIVVKDNGIGMDELTKKRLFEPFFTTKPVGEGTGLGLSIAFNTIKKHNGTIEVNSKIGIGTEFIIQVPVSHLKS